MLMARSKHLEGIMPAHKQGTVPFGGSYLAAPPKEGETPQMLGSAIVVVAETEEQVRETLRNDIYARSGVWDVDKATVYPFKTAVRSALS